MISRLESDYIKDPHWAPTCLTWSWMWWDGASKSSPWCMLFADDIVLCSTRRDHVERKLEEWRRAMDEQGMKICRRKYEYVGCNEHQYAEIQLQERHYREWRHSHTQDRRWRMIENWMWKSPTECRAGGRTGRECTECCATGEWTRRSMGRCTEQW